MHFFGSVSLVISFVVGVLMGTHLPILVQIGCVALGFWLCGKEPIRSLEIGALYFIGVVFVFALGCIIGDISYAYQTDAWSKIDWTSPFKVK